MTNREFMAFVRRPRYMESEDAIQLFEDPTEDENGKTRYATNVAVMTPVVLMLLGFSAYLSNDLWEVVWNFLLCYLGGI